MHTEKREDPLVELGYEVRDLNTVAIRNATIGFFVFAIGSAVIGFGAYRVMNPTVFEPAAKQRVLMPAPPNPLIQSNMAAKVDIMDLRQHETAVLTAPIGWGDPQKTYLHIPIDKAMDLIAAHGLKPTGSSIAIGAPETKPQGVPPPPGKRARGPVGAPEPNPQSAASVASQPGGMGAPGSASPKLNPGSAQGGSATPAPSAAGGLPNLRRSRGASTGRGQ